MPRLAELSARRLAPSPRPMGPIERVWQWYRARQTERTTVRALGALDDRTLKDIGMDRSEIESVVYGGLGEPAPNSVRRIHFAGRS
jgi:uncharacterized protein YjiS (DUF1127 family)